MARAIAISVLSTALALLALAPAPARASDLQYNGRKLRRHSQPVLPEIARQMHLTGTVRLQIEVSPAGKVTAVKALGGHPILITSAANAVKEWLFEPDPHSTTVVVSFTFK
ncbi:MAG TPA: energy transducer TonB [Terriglobales bacterium]|nr:energy transducer TonB [Terriglobales bacterium]